MSESTGDQSKLTELMKDIKIAMLTTVDPEGHFTARPMAQQEIEFDGDLWFFAEAGSTAVRDIGRDAHVGVTLSSASTWISVCGSAETVTDAAKAKELWNAGVEAWLPQGPEDPSVVLIKVSADSAEYWDTPGGRVASVLSFVKSKVTGERYSGGENATVEL